LTTKVHFVATPVPEGQAALENLRMQYNDVGPDEADIVVALGGDGFMLQTLHTFVGHGKPIYGMHRGTVGFLMNEFSTLELHARLAMLPVLEPRGVALMREAESGTTHSGDRVSVSDGGPAEPSGGREVA